MKSGSPPPVELEWRQILRLGQELVHLASIADQKKLLEDTLPKIIPGDVTLWVDPAAFQLPTGFFEFEQDPQIPALVTQAFREKRLEQIRQPRPAAALPLISQDVCLAVLQVERDSGLDFQENELDFLRSLADNCAVALQASRQAAIKGWRYEQLNLVRQVSAQIANLFDLDELSTRVTRLICDTFHYYYVGLYTLSTAFGRREHGEKPDELLFRASASSDNLEAGSSFSQVTLGQGIVGAVAENGEEILANDVEQEPRFRYIDSLPDAQAEFAIPLKVENRILGVLDIQSNHKHAYHEIDVLVLHALADNIALAIEGIRLYRDVHHRAEQIAVVGEVSRAITSILDLDAVLDEVVRLIQRRFGFPFVHLFTVHNGNRKIIYRAGGGEKSATLRKNGLAYDLDDGFGIIPWVARNGKTLLANDVTTEVLYRPSDLPPKNTQAELAIPICFGSETLGVLDIQSDSRGAFNEDDRFLLETLSDSISIAIRNAMVYQSEHYRRQVAESLRDVAAMLASEVDINQILNTILRELERNLPCDIVAIWLLEAEPGEGPERLKLAASHGKDIETQARVRALSDNDIGGLAGSLSLEEPVLRKPDEPSELISAVLDHPQDYSSITAPLRVGNQALGILVIAHATAGRYGNDALAMAAAFASYASIAVQNTHLYASIQEQAWISTVMLQVADATRSIRSMDELLKTVVRLTPMLVGVTSAAVLLWDEAGAAFSLAATYEISPPLMEWLNKRLSDLASHPAFTQMRSQTNGQWVTWGELGLPYPLEGEAGWVHWMPIIARGNFLGLFLVEQQVAAALTRGNTIHQSSVLQGIVQQTAIAMENIRLIETKQEEAYVTAVLLQAAQAVVSSNDLDDILDSIVHIMPILVGIDSCIIYLWDDVHQLFRPSHAVCDSARVENQVLSCLFSRGEYPVLDHVYQTDHTLVFPLEPALESPVEWPTIQLSEDQAIQPAALDHDGSLLIGVPLTVKGSVYGVMLAQEYGSTRSIRSRRLEIISGIAQEAALAIQNARLTREMVERERLEREIQLARDIQRTFLPSQLPSPDGWQVNYRWRTARQVGGDFYDCFELPDNRLGVVIADVSDKGMPAAMVMTVTRTLIRATAQEVDSPAAVLQRVNNLLLMDSQTGMFVTAVYAILSLKSAELTYCVAGHNLPLWIHHSGGEIETFVKDGVALGVWPEIQLHDHLIALESQDTVLLYTDGITDAIAPDNTFFNEDHLLEVLRQKPPESADEILDRIDQAVIKFISDMPVADDMTLVAIRRE